MHGGSLGNELLCKCWQSVLLHQTHSQGVHNDQQVQTCVQLGFGTVVLVMQSCLYMVPNVLVCCVGKLRRRLRRRQRRQQKPKPKQGIPRQIFRQASFPAKSSCYVLEPQVACFRPAFVREPQLVDGSFLAAFVCVGVAFYTAESGCTCTSHYSSMLMLTGLSSAS